MEKETKRGEGITIPPLVFLGTPDFAAPSLRYLLEAGAPVRLVITQPDRPSGRGRRVSQSAVKVLAEQVGISVYQPERIRGDDIIDHIRSYGAECAIVVAFGQILPQKFLDAFPLGTLNVHASLLPRYRGAAPIQRAILSGEEVTGVSIMLLDAGMDTGPVLSQARVPIGPEDAFGTIHDRLSETGAMLLLDTFRRWIAGRIAPVPQDGGLATYAPPLRKEELRIQWNLAAKDIINRIRAFDPVPGAFFQLGARRVKSFRARAFPIAGTGKPGEVIGISESGLIVAGGDGKPLAVGELQMEGQRRMRADEFTRGRSIPVGTILE